MANNFSLPSVGQGACFTVGSDRYPATVIKVTAKTVTLQEANATPAAGHEYFGSQKYEFTPNPNGALRVARWSNKSGAWKIGKYSFVSFNGYGKYSDPSF